MKMDTIQHLAFVNALTESATPAIANKMNLVLEVASRTATNLEEAEFAQTAKKHLVKNWKKYAAGAALVGAAGAAYASSNKVKDAVQDAVHGGNRVGVAADVAKEADLKKERDGIIAGLDATIARAEAEGNTEAVKVLKDKKKATTIKYGDEINSLGKNITVF